MRIFHYHVWLLVGMMIVWWFLILFNMFLICCTVIVCAVQSQNADAQWFRMPPDPTCQACPGRCRSCTAAEHLRTLRRVRWVLRLSKSAVPWWKPQINWFLVCFSCFKVEQVWGQNKWHTMTHFHRRKFKLMFRNGDSIKCIFNQIPTVRENGAKLG